jgi:hypothetical protein
MKASFINKSAQIIPDLTTGGLDSLNFLARCKNIETNLDTLRMAYESLITKMNLGYRQEEEQKQLLGILNGTFMEKLFLDFPMLPYGKVNNLFVNLAPDITLEWEYIKAYPVYSYEPGDGIPVYNQHTSEVLSMQIEHSGSLIAEYNEIPEYTLVHAKLSKGAYTKNIVINKNPAEIEFLSYYNGTEWNILPGTDIVAHVGEYPIDMSFDYIKELVFIVRNKKINNNYVCQVDFLAFSPLKKQLINEIDFTIDYASGLFLSNIQEMMDPGLKLFFDGHILYKNQRYEVQIPTYVNAISRLEVVSHLPSETIFRSSYPVKVDSPVELYKSLKSWDLLEGWQVSLTGEIGSWVSSTNISNLDYSTQPATKARYLYFRVSGYLPTAYVSYQPYVDIGSIWPLSEDGNLFYNGVGVGLKTPGKVRIVGSIYGNQNINTYEKFPVAMLGVD